MPFLFHVGTMVKVFPGCFRILSAKDAFIEPGMEELNSLLVTGAQSQKFHDTLGQGQFSRKTSCWII